MITQHLQLSAKFAAHLSKLGMLDSLVNTLRQFQEKEAYPFELEQMRIIKQAVFKGLTDYYGSIGKKPSLEKILETTEKIAERFYGKKTSFSKEFVEEIKKEPEKEIPLEEIPF